MAIRQKRHATLLKSENGTHGVTRFQGKFLEGGSCSQLSHLILSNLASHFKFLRFFLAELTYIYFLTIIDTTWTLSRCPSWAQGHFQMYISFIGLDLVSLRLFCMILWLYFYRFINAGIALKGRCMPLRNSRLKSRFVFVCAQKLFESVGGVAPPSPC